MLAVGALVAIVVRVGSRVRRVARPGAGVLLLLRRWSAHGTKNVLIRTLIHERVPSSLHGRAFAAYNGLRNAAELVALVAGGLLVSTLGARWTMLLAGAIPMAVGLVALAVSSGVLAETVVSGAPASSWPRDDAKLERVRRLMAEQELDALVVRAPDNVLYLTNFWG